MVHAPIQAYQPKCITPWRTSRPGYMWRRSNRTNTQLGQAGKQLAWVKGLESTDPWLQPSPESSDCNLSMATWGDVPVLELELGSAAA